MKKLFLMLAAIFMATAVYAGEAAVLEKQRQLLQLLADFELDKALELLHPEYVEVDTDGGVTTRDKAVMIAELYKITQKIMAGNAKLSDFMLLVTVASGREVTAEMRQQFLAMDNAPDAAEKQALIRGQVMPYMTQYNNSLATLKSQMQSALNTYKVISCAVNGSEAKVIYEIREIDSEKIEIREADWIKVDGKWLCKKEVCRYK